MQSVVGVAMVPEAILEKLEPMLKVLEGSFLSIIMLYPPEEFNCAH